MLRKVSVLSVVVSVLLALGGGMAAPASAQGRGYESYGTAKVTLKKHCGLWGSKFDKACKKRWNEYSSMYDKVHVGDKNSAAVMVSLLGGSVNFKRVEKYVLNANWSEVAARYPRNPQLAKKCWVSSRDTSKKILNELLVKKKHVSDLSRSFELAVKAMKKNKVAKVFTKPLMKEFSKLERTAGMNLYAQNKITEIYAYQFDSDCF